MPQARGSVKPRVRAIAALVPCSSRAGYDTAQLVFERLDVVMVVVNRLLLFVSPLVFVLGCVDQTPGDMALIEVRRVQAENQTNGLRLAAIESRQMYLVQQMSILSGVLDTLAKENAARIERSEKEDDESLARIERLEKIEVARREQERQEAPARTVERAQALLNGGQLKVTTRNGRAQLVFPDAQAGAGDASPPKRPETPRDLEDPWAAPRKPLPKRPKRLSDDLGF